MIDRLRQLTGCKIRPVLAPHSNILEFVNKCSKGSTDADSFLASLTDSDVKMKSLCAMRVLRGCVRGRSC